MQPRRIAIVGVLVDALIGFRGELIRDLALQGHTVYAFATDYTDGTRAAVRLLGAEPADWRIAQLGTNPLTDTLGAVGLYRSLKKLNIDLSYCYFTKPAIYGNLAAWAAGVPTRVVKLEGLGRVFTRDPEGDPRSKRLLRSLLVRLFRLSLPKAHHLFVLNQGDQDDIRRRFGICNPDPVLINGIGVSLDEYTRQPASADPVRFIFVGRLLREKGIHYFLQAARALKEDHPEAEFVVLGSPDSSGGIGRYELKRLVEQGIITYPGAVADVRPWLAETSVFVLPTWYREGVPRSIQEALATGRPVITTDMPGCRETVDHGVNGYLVPVHDSHALTSAMRWFVENPEQIQPMGEASYRIACERFDVRKINHTILTTLGLALPDPDEERKTQTPKSACKKPF